MAVVVSFFPNVVRFHVTAEPLPALSLCPLLAAKGWAGQGQHHGGKAAPAADEEAQPDRPGEQAEDTQDPGRRRRG